MSERDERSPVWGIEWDFLAVDADGRVACLSSAGFGPIPDRVLAHQLLVERAMAEVEDLPVLGPAEDRRDTDDRAGNYADWFRMSECGLFAYDWHNGAYRLVSAPTKGVEPSALSSTIRQAANLLALPLRFAEEPCLNVE
ncbi:hypothetical protein AADG42_14785 [Ammonicoccus fulvus]|uniref:Uncharacterized protein n=1 Tax=Ammonicoccus fulvus TaxID=3138240 RepID=A0ABZ3FTU0_9ACTN